MESLNNASHSEHDNIPVVSVVMAARNAERFISQAIDSVLAQTFGRFEFIIINDGSTDRTTQIIRSYADPRIIYTDNGIHLGLSRSFNRGVALARGKFVARMDADDICIPHRFEKQISFLENQPDIAIVGSNLWVIDEYGRYFRTLRHPATHIGIKWASLFSTPMFHPTILARADVMKAHPYDEQLSNSEDYELWSRLLFTTQTKFANIREPLLYFRYYPESFTQTLERQKREISVRNTINNLSRYMDLDAKDKDALLRLRQQRWVGTPDLVRICRIYAYGARSFIRREQLEFRDASRVYSQFASITATLFKYKLKTLLTGRVS